MISLTIGEIANAIGGTVIGDSSVLVSGPVETDSRLVVSGSLFVAKPGEVTDGHHFVVSAKQAGAVAAIVQHPVLNAEISQVVVTDSVAALGSLAKYVLGKVRASADLKVIGITGSNGKTTTKNMLREILSLFGNTIAPIESYNNEVGAPYSILQVDELTKFLVVEMGAGGPGSIQYLAEIAKPDIGVVLKVGLAHVGEFGGIESTARIKAELVSSMPESGLLVLNNDDGYVREMAKLSSATKFWFGTSADSSYRATDLQLTIEGTSFEMTWPDSSTASVSLKILGEHHVMNAVAALTVADLLNLDRQKSVAALEAMPLAERWRMQLMQRSDGVTIINDAYNASPDSMKAALQTLAQLGRNGRRTVAVLGEMAELGESSREQHDAIGRLVVRLNIDQLVVVGAGAKLIHMGAEQEGSWAGESKYFESIAEAFVYLREMLVADDLVLVKSSKSADLRHLGDDLMEAK